MSLKSDELLSVNLTMSIVVDGYAESGGFTMTSFIDNRPRDIVTFMRKFTPKVVSDNDPSSYTMVKGAAIICSLEEFDSSSILEW